ncbi:capsular polysaccharide transport system ATP-binding protein [Rhizorhabdus histidinilytica]|jgi:capsular polysaccharide transport system ATP-binding protein|uniref:Capsular polysaccharide transport system ATP-binding protein n=2 Tax=Rhizorhabdus histidinilytica TaxID=439228 RepID=A0A1T5GZ31_9SPHN|nr:capsular polysaccharide transport system ATP-binding protein [Rhizorhabdus histidinilytica]
MLVRIAAWAGIVQPFVSCGAGIGEERSMIRFENVSKTYHIRKFQKQVFSNLNFEIRRGESIGICGANGAGKSTLMRLIAGVEQPTTGRIERSMTTSWPIGYSSAFQASMTGSDNVRFIARIYRQPEQEILDYVEDFAQLGPYFHQPVRTYSSGMAGRLAFGISLAINFDCYLVDEVTGAGDERFRRRSHEELMKRRAEGTLVMVSHDPHMLQQYCERGAVLYGGNLTFYDTVAEASEVHHGLQMRAA